VHILHNPWDHRAHCHPISSSLYRLLSTHTTHNFRLRFIAIVQLGQRVREIEEWAWEGEFRQCLWPGLGLATGTGPGIWDLGSGHTFVLHDKTFVANFLCTVVASKWQFNNGHYFLAKRYELNIFSTCIIFSNNLIRKCL